MSDGARSECWTMLPYLWVDSVTAEVAFSLGAEQILIDAEELLEEVDHALKMIDAYSEVPTVGGVTLLELIEPGNLDASKRSGRPPVLTEADKDKLAAFIRTGFETRRMALTDIKRESGFGHVSNQTISRALEDRGIGQYREEFKFILKSENKIIRLRYCEERKHWTMVEWGNTGFTDEMSIEVGAQFGLNCVWRDKTEQWHEDCVGARKKQGPTVMCWGMIGWNFKGPFHVWLPESDEEKAESLLVIENLMGELNAEADKLNAEWKGSRDWEQTKARELQAARLQRLAESKGAAREKVPQSWRGKKYKVEKIKRGEKGGIESWRYVKDLARPILWPECKRRLLENHLFQLMEDNAASHNSHYTNGEREKEGISKIIWPPNSPDLNPIERIWAIIKFRILRRRGSERITSVTRMQEVLVEEWEKITIEEINKEIAKLPTIVARCIAVQGGNNFHA